MFWMALLDVFLASVLLGAPGLDRPLADAHYPCATPVICDCPEDSPCKKDCCKDACTCKQTAALAACTQAVCPPAVPMPGPSWTPACPVAYPAPCVPAMAPVAAAHRLYEVSLKVGKHTHPKMTLPAGQFGTIMVTSAEGKSCQVSLHLADSDDGLVKTFVRATFTSKGCGGYPYVTAYEGKKKLHLDTVSNVPLEGDEAEPLCAEVLVKLLGVDGVTAYPVPLSYAPCPGWNGCPAPVAVPVPPPMPAPAAPMACLPPMPVNTPYCPPEPLPLPAPAPVVEPCVAVVPRAAKSITSCAHVELVRCCEKSTLKVKDEGDGWVKSVRLTIDKGDCGALTVAAGKKYVHVHGKKWKAYADSVEILADGHVKLMGNVKLMSEKLGVCTTMKAEKLCVQVKDGKFEKIVEH